MSIVDGARTHYRLFGSQGLMMIARARLSRKPMQIVVASEKHRQPVHLRMRTTDVSVYEEIIVNSEYEFDIEREPSVIVDAGANIGLTSVYFANRFGNAKIIAVEPERSNFEMLLKNSERYENIVPLEAALWRADTAVNLSDPGTGCWGFQIEERERVLERGPRVRALTLDTLMREVGVDHIDILKVDIEGSEKEVFECCGKWIDRVGVLVVELHDRFKSGCSAAVLDAAQDFPISWTRGETSYFFRADRHPTRRSSKHEAPNPPAAGHAVVTPVRARVIGVHC